MNLARRWLIALLASVTALAVAAPAAGAATCKPRGSQTVKATSKVRVFTRTSEARGWEKLYACRRRGKRTVTIATRYPGSENLPFVTWDEDLLRIRGNYAAIPVTKEYDDDQTDAYAVIADTTRRRVRGRAAVTGEQSVITDLVLGSGGNAAFLTRVVAPGTAGATDRRIDRVSRTGRTSLVASSPDIAEGSLRLADGILSWLQGGEQKTAPLVAP